MNPGRLSELADLKRLPSLPDSGSIVVGCLLYQGGLQVFVWDL